MLLVYDIFDIVNSADEDLQYSGEIAGAIARAGGMLTFYYKLALYKKMLESMY